MPEAIPNLAASRPSFRTVTGWTIWFMVLLRIAIGWHFFYEGLWKVCQDDWRATSYLVASAGPFREVFRAMVDDVDGVRALTLVDIKRRLDERCLQLIDHYEITDEKLIAKINADTEKCKSDAAFASSVESIFADPDFQQQRADYLQLLEEVKAQEAKLGTTDFEKERLVDMYARKARAKAAVLERLEAPLRALDESVLYKMDVDQLGHGAPPGEGSPTWWIDLSNMWALTLVGACLMLGLFTRLAALGGIGLLCLYYFAMPPFPGLPDNPMSEGHYLIINKNLIEMIALMMLATSRVGRWGGLDAWIAPIGRCRGSCPAATSSTGAGDGPANA